jgi:hypothetical protein
MTEIGVSGYGGQSAVPPYQTLPYVEVDGLYVIKQEELWADSNQQKWHEEALQWYGEKCVVRKLWRAEDAAAGLVTYCIDCQDSPNPTNPTQSVQVRASKVYRQSGNSYCPTCYGTTFTGGFQMVVYHLYMLAGDSPQVRQKLSTGQFWKENPQVQFSHTPDIRQGDLVIRISKWDGDLPVQEDGRFQVSNTIPHSIRTGPTPSNDFIHVISQTCTLENVWPDHPLYYVPYI